MCASTHKSCRSTCRDVPKIGTVTQVFRNITTEWLEIVWVNPATGPTEQIISTPGHRFLKYDGSYDCIIDMVDCSVVGDAANDNHDEADNSFGGKHPFSRGVERPIGIGPDEQIVSDAWVASSRLCMTLCWMISFQLGLAETYILALD